MLIMEDMLDIVIMESNLAMLIMGGMLDMVIREGNLAMPMEPMVEKEKVT